MARYFIPGDNDDPAKSIPKEMWYAIEESLPKDTIVCVGAKIDGRDIDVLVLTRKHAHVVEVKNLTLYPVVYIENQGLCDKNGDLLEPIVNVRGNREESAISQAIAEANTVKRLFERNSLYSKAFPYISIPSPCEGSSVPKKTGFAWIKLGLKDLMFCVCQRDDYDSTSSFSEENRISIAKVLLHLDEVSLDRMVQLSHENEERSASPVSGVLGGRRAFRSSRYGCQKPLSRTAKAGFMLFFVGLVTLMAKSVIMGTANSKGNNALYRSLEDSALLYTVPWILLLVGLVLALLPQLFSAGGNSSSPTSKAAYAMGVKTGKLFGGLKAFFSSKKVIVIAFAVVLIGGLSLVFLFSGEEACSTVNSLNVRSAPSLESRVVGSVKMGECLSVSAISADRSWLKISGIKYAGKWVSAGHVNGVNLSSLKVFHE